MKNSIKLTPTDKFPQMVTITRGRLRGKRFVNKETALQRILEIEQQMVLNRVRNSIKKDIQKLTTPNLYY